MALPQSGAISFANINEQLGVASTTTRTLNDAAVRALFRNGVNSTSGATISLSEGYTFNYSFAASTTYSNTNLRSALVTAGWNQSAYVIATIPSTAIMRSTANVGTGLVIDGSFPNHLYVNNAGIIVGKGGNGGYYNTLATTIVAAVAGGTGLSVATGINIKFNNTGTIAGGGGGGGFRANNGTYGTLGGSGGAGYGVDGWNWNYGTKYHQYAGNAASNQTATATATTASNIWTTLPYYNTASTASGKPTPGYGGTLGASGQQQGSWYSSFTDKWGTFYTNVTPAAANNPAAGGAATSGSANVTWVATGTRYGTIG